MQQYTLERSDILSDNLTAERQKRVLDDAKVLCVKYTRFLWSYLQEQYAEECQAKFDFCIDKIAESAVVVRICSENFAQMFAEAPRSTDMPASQQSQLARCVAPLIAELSGQVHDGERLPFV